MPTDDPRTLLHDAAAGPVAPLDHDELRRRARGRSRSRWAAGGVAVLAAIVGVGGLVADLQGPLTLDVVDTPGGTVVPADPLPGLPEFPVTLDLPPVGEVAAVHAGERPVFVAHLDTGDVLVVDAISPHDGSSELPKVVAFCRDPWVFETEDGQTVVNAPGEFSDLWHGSLFAIDGSWLGGPAPTGLPTYEVRSVGDNTVEVGPPGPAPNRVDGPFTDVLGPRDTINGRRVSGGDSDCSTTYDQTRDAGPPADETAVLWHESQHPDRWLYPFEGTAPSPSDITAETEPVPPGEGRRVWTFVLLGVATTGIGGFVVYRRRTG